MQKERGFVYAWGWAESGQIGQVYSQKCVTTPEKISFLSEKRIASLSCGLSHSLAITDTGRSFVFGKGAYGRLGLGSERDELSPKFLTICPNSNKRAIMGCCGGFHTAIITNKGELYTFGRGQHGQLGDNSNVNRLVPVLVNFFKDQKVSKVSCGNSHTLASTRNGALYSWGLNDKGQLGLGDTKSRNVPEQIVQEGLSGPVIALECGEHHCLVSIGGSEIKTWAWGNNHKGQCGIGSTDPLFLTVPTVVPKLKGKQIVSVSGGVAHSAVVDYSGEVYTWGDGEQGQLGYGAIDAIISQQSSNIPRRVKEALFGQRIIQISCGTYHTIALSDNGTVYAWGLGDQGQIGVGSKSNVSEPALIRGKIEGERIQYIAAGGRHSLCATGYVPLIKIGESTFNAEIKKLFDDQILCDVKIGIDQHTIKCHSLFLSRTKEFKKLLKNHKTSKGKYKLQIPNIRHDVLLCLIKFLYYDEVKIVVDQNEKEITKTADEQEEELAVLLRSAAERFGVSLAKQKFATVHSMLQMGVRQHLKNFVCKKKFSDVTFNCQGELLPAHKAILCARVERFRALFLGGFKETSKQVIDVPIRPEVFKLILEYIYTDKVNNIPPDDAVELLMAANEYGLNRLKQMAEKLIEEGIDVENVAWLFEICDQNESQQLKKFCLYFLLNEFESVCKTETYKNLNKQSLDEIQKLRKPQGDSGKCSLQ